MATPLQHINTGQAAQLAYNNIFPSSIDQDQQINGNNGQHNSFMKYRANGVKSRNNYSLTDNSNKEASLSTGAIAGGQLVGPQSQSFIQNHFEGHHRGSLGNPTLPQGNLLRNYESEASIFADLRGSNLNENSFSEQMLEKNKIVYS